MPTSNSTDWTLNRDQVITGALRKLAVLPSGATPSTSQIADASDALNAIVKAFQADGMPLWKVSKQTFTTVSGTAAYTVGPSQTVDCPKPLRVYQAFWTPQNGTNTPLNIYNRYDFNELPQGTGYSGAPVNLLPLATAPRLSSSITNLLTKIWTLPVTISISRRNGYRLSSTI
jgi:hypothetical protein